MAYDVAEVRPVLERLTSGFLSSDDAKLLADGLPLSAVDEFIRRIAPDDVGLKYRLVPKATYTRRKNSGRGLTIEEGERVLRLFRIWSFAEYVFGKPWKVRRFMMEPHWLLDERAPVDLVLESEVGAKVVEQILGRALHGIAL